MARSFVFVLALSALVALAYAEELYPDKYDYIDVDAILSNDRIRNQYYGCFLETSPCLTPDSKFFKDKFPESIVTKCRKCTNKQKYMFERIVLYYTEKEPEKWNLILTKAIEKAARKRSA